MATPFSDFNELTEGSGGNKRLSVERIYQRKTQLEHILLRPDTYVGSVEESTQHMWVFDEEKQAIVSRQITYVPGLYKIFDEILVNAADNKQRDPKMNAIKIIIDPENNLISVWNNGAGIPVEMHAVEKMYVPELIFGTLLTSSNYDDKQKKVTGGRNGYGAKLCNIFSTEFTVETASSESGKHFKQTWKNNMGVSGKHSVTSAKKDFTKVTFKPDLSKFNMTHLDKDIVSLMTRRAYDIAGCTKGVAVYLNDNKLPVKSFKDYVELYIKGQPNDEDDDMPRKVVHEIVSPRWEVCVTSSASGFQQSSFVNSIATTKGGTHVQLVVDQLVSKVLEVAKKKNKGGMDLKPFHVKNHLWIFINCLIENPSFDSQTKENMTLKAKSFGSTCQLSDKFIKQVLNCGIVERILNWAKVKSQSQLNKKQHGSKNSKLKGIPKLDDANDAGSKHSGNCTLIVTEGDSAKTLAVSGLGVVGRDNYGVFPLRGKLLNVREASHTQIMNNEEIKSVIKILGLQYGKKYTDEDELKSLRYGRIMIMADQDQDGSHIKGLVINFFHHNWPHLLRHSFIEEFITPIVKVTKGKQELAFFSLPEFERWKTITENSHTWKVKYYKGLGTSTAKEAKEYFSDMDLHRIPFQYQGPEDDQAIELAFSKKCVNDRKEWLTTWLQQRREKRTEGFDESFLYGERTDSITYSEFINKELILFSNMDNERSIPSMVDGLKPGQRKVLFTCFKRNDKKDIKVAQLAGSVAEHSAYHHGEQSLMATIINLAQNFVGSNNLNLLQPIGQFGTRLHGGKDAASPRYIFTMLSPLARHLFPSSDDPQLVSLFDDNQRIEPEWYCPIIPMVLVNGAEGIGTGYSTTVPNYNPRDIVANLKRMIAGIEPEEMKPWYKKFKGTIAPVEPQKYMVYGRVGLLGPTSFEITELPIKTWTQSYKENVLEPMLHGTDKAQPFITDYKEYHTDTTVKFVVTLTEDKLREAQEIGIHKKFKLESSINTSNMVLFDADGCLKKYEGESGILREFYDVRLTTYHKRKRYIEGQLEAESSRLNNQARFIMEKIEGKVVIENKSKADMIKELVSRGYDSDPVKTWKKSLVESSDDDNEGEESRDSEDGPDYNYLLSMQLWNLTKEKKEELLKNRDKKAEELDILRKKTPKDLWKEDLETFLVALDEVEEQERQEEQEGAAITVKKKTKGKGGRQAKLTATGKTNSVSVTKPSAFAEIIEPIVPEFCAIKKEKGVKVKKPKVDPSPSKLEPSSETVCDEDVVLKKTKVDPSQSKLEPSSETVCDEDVVLKKPKVDPSQSKLEPSSETVCDKVVLKKLKVDPSQSKLKFQPSSETVCDDVMLDDVLVVEPPPKKKAAVIATEKSDEDNVATKSVRTKKKATVTAATKKHPVKRIISDSENSSPKRPTKKTVKKSPLKRPTKKTVKKSPLKRPSKKTTPHTSSDDEEEELPKQRSTRHCKRIKYNFSENEESDEEEWQQDYGDDDDDYEEMD